MFLAGRFGNVDVVLVVVVMLKVMANCASFQDKVALVTGGSRGIDKAAALALFGPIGRLVLAGQSPSKVARCPVCTAAIAASMPDQCTIARWSFGGGQERLGKMDGQTSLDRFQAHRKWEISDNVSFTKFTRITAVRGRL